jgi:hypothetical protein
VLCMPCQARQQVGHKTHSQLISAGCTLSTHHAAFKHLSRFAQGLGKTQAMLSILRHTMLLFRLPAMVPLQAAARLCNVTKCSSIHEPHSSSIKCGTEDQTLPTAVCMAYQARPRPCCRGLTSLLRIAAWHAKRDAACSSPM